MFGINKARILLIAVISLLITVVIMSFPANADISIKDILNTKDITVTKTKIITPNLDGSKTARISSSTEQIMENDKWIKKEDAQSLKAYYDIKYIEIDPRWVVTVNDFNNDWIDVTVVTSDKNIPVRFNGENSYVTSIPSGRQIIYVDNILLFNNISFGTASTTIELKDADTENTDDGYILWYDTLNYYGELFSGSRTITFNYYSNTTSWSNTGYDTQDTTWDVKTGLYWRAFSDRAFGGIDNLYVVDCNSATTIRAVIYNGSSTTLSEKVYSSPTIPCGTGDKDIPANYTFDAITASYGYYWVGFEANNEIEVGIDKNGETGRRIYVYNGSSWKLEIDKTLDMIHLLEYPKTWNFFCFNTSDLDGTTTDATLSLFFGSLATNTYATIEIYEINDTSSWTEEDTTWGNKPSYDTNKGIINTSFVADGVDDNSYINFTVTSGIDLGRDRQCFYAKRSNTTEGTGTLTISMKEETGTTQDPILYITYDADTQPPGTTISLPVNLSYDTTVSIGIATNETANTCLYNIGGANTTLTEVLTNIWTGSIATGLMVNGTTYNFKLYCNDTNGNMGLNDSIWFTYDVQDETPPSDGTYNYTFTSPVNGANHTETESVDFVMIMNIERPTYEPESTAYLWYDGVRYTATSQTETTYGIYRKITVTRTLTLPLIDDTPTNEEKSWLWEMFLEYQNGTVRHENTTSNTSNVWRMILNDTSYCEQTLRFNIYDENTGLLIDNSTFTGAFTITKNNITDRVYSYEQNGSNNFTFYISPCWEQFYLDADIEYIASEYSQRTWHTNGLLITNTSQTINMYLLATDNASAVKLLVKDANYNNVPDIIVEIYKYDIATGTNILMTIVETDADGKALTYLETDVTKYYFILKRNGITVNTQGPIVIIDDGTSPIQQILYLETLTEEWYELVAGIDGGCSFDSTENITTCTGTDNTPDQYVNKWCMVVKKYGILEVNELNNTCIYGSSATMTHTFSTGSEGEHTWVFYAMTDNYDYIVDMGSYNFTSGTMFGLWGVFIAFFVILAVTIVGIFHPPIAGIFCVMGIVFAMMLGLVEVLWSSVGGLMIVAILIYIGGNKR